MMDTLSEVIDYCNLDKPAGALLLTGEWGSGKTYLVDHKLQETLKDTHLFLRVSMFGISDTEVLKKAVLTKWLQTIGPESDRVRKAKQIVRRAGNGVKSVLPDTGPALELLNSLLDIDLLLFFPLKNEYKEKKVVLVFDDFERADIKPQNILGVINDYCENQHFHVIIVTYEGKIRHVSEPKRADEASGELLYKEIKEKCVQRTLKLVPDYDEIVPSVFEDMASGDYRT
ncbi:MAG: AAA family ATPase, partial [Oscillospiraceae bacterium]|nr:AAA family ATPase [Oscillospiraceae bacterium]